MVTILESSHKPVLALTGEQTLGFRNLSTGSFQEVCLLRDQTDLDQFRKDYGIVGEIRKVY